VLTAYSVSLASPTASDHNILWSIRAMYHHILWFGVDSRLSTTYNRTTN